MLVAVRALGGLFGGTATVAAVFIVLLFPQKERGKQFAKMSVGALSAFVFGPFVGGGLAQFGLRIPLYAAAGLSALAMIAAFYFVTDPNQLAEKLNLNKGGKDKDGKEKKKLETVDPNFKPWKSLRVYIISAQTMFTTLAFNGLSSLIALVLLEERLGVVLPTDTVEIQGRKVALWVMAYVPAIGGSQVIVLMALFPRFLKNVGLLPTGAIGSVFMALALVLIPFYPHPGYVFITQVLLAIGNGLQTNVSNTYLSKFAPKGHAAQVLSYGTMADTIGNILGPQLTQIYLVDSKLPFFIASSFGLCSMVCCVVLHFMGNHEHEDHKKGKDEGSLLQSDGDSSSNTAESKSVELAEKQEEEDSLKSDLDLESQPLVQLIHPACQRSLGKGPRGTGELADEDQVKFTSASYQRLTTMWYNDLKEKNHLYGLRSKVTTIRNRTVAAHADWFQKELPAFPDPNDDTEDKEFRESVALFLEHSGHHDWALNVPGIDLDSVLQNIQVPM